MTRRTNHAHADESFRTPSPEEQLAGTMFAPSVEPTPPVRQIPVRAHLRRVDGPPRPDPATRRDEAMESFASQDAVRKAVVYLRARLLELYRSRAASDRQAFVTADDAARILDEWAHCPPELRAMKSQNWRGIIFRGKGWERTGQRYVSQRGDMHAHDYPCWRPVL